MKTILLDGSPMGGGISGAGRYAYYLIDRLLSLDSPYEYHVIHPPAESCVLDFEGWRSYPGTQLTPADISGAGIDRQWFYLRNRFNYDLFHSMSSYLPVGITGTSVLTIHDLKQFRSDLFFSGYSRLKWAYIRKMIARSIYHADSIITVSEFTKSDVVDLFSVNTAQVHATPLGPVPLPADPSVMPLLDAPYFLFVGELRPHKNLATLLEAYKLFRERTETDVELAVAGRQYGSENPIQSVASQHRDAIHVLGEVDDEMLAALYQGATAYVFPSLYEGFGLPILEAMQFGTPVIVSNTTSLPEVAGDAGLYVDPTDPESISQKLECFATQASIRDEYSKRAQERYADFSWEQTARKTINVYKSILQ